MCTGNMVFICKLFLLFEFLGSKIIRLIIVGFLENVNLVL